MRHPAKAYKHTKKAREFLARHGYKVGGAVEEDEREDRKIAATAVHKHERNMHKGEPLTKLKRGGRAEGGKARARLDKMARGGRVPKDKAHTKVNVVVMPGERKTPVPVPVPVGGPPRPPISPAAVPPGAAGLPPGVAGLGAPGGGRPGLMRRGGRVR